MRPITRYDGTVFLKLMTFFMIVFFSLPALISCNRNAENQSTTEKKENQEDPLKKIVATVGQGYIYENDLIHYLNDKRGRPAKSPKEFISDSLKELITREALYQEAVRSGLDQDPVVRQNIRQMMGQALLQRDVILPVINREITEQELKQYYQEHIPEFSRPDQVRLFHIFIATPKGISFNDKMNLQEKAQSILQKVKNYKKSMLDFSRLAKQYSDKHPLYPLGNTGFFDRKGRPMNMEKSVVDAAFSINRPGDIYDGVIHSQDGFHIIMLAAKQKGFEKKFSQVRKMLEQRIRKKELSTKRDEFISGIVGNTQQSVSVDAVEAMIDKIEIPFGMNDRRKKGTENRLDSQRPPDFPGQD